LGPVTNPRKGVAWGRKTIEEKRRRTEDTTEPEIATGLKLKKKK